MSRHPREIEEAKLFESTKAMLAKMQNPRRPMSESTIRAYCGSVMIFTKFMKAENPDAALKMVKKDLFKHADSFVDYLMNERKNAPKTARVIFHGFKFWLEMNDVDTKPLKRVTLPRNSDTKVEDRKPTMKELYTILAFANIRNTAMIQIGISSGLRVSTLADIRLSEITWNPYESLGQKVDDENAPAMISVQPREKRKTTRKFFTFITPQAKQSLRLYLDWRKRKGETLTENSHIMGSDENTNEGETITGETLTKTWLRLLEKAGLDKKTHGWNELHFHTLRKFFKSECINTAIPNQYSEFWMGHTGGYLDASYFRENLKEHLAEYSKAIPNLTVKSGDVINADIQKLYQNGEQKEKRIEELTTRMYDLQQGSEKLKTVMELLVSKTTDEKLKQELKILLSIMEPTKPQDK